MTKIELSDRSQLSWLRSIRNYVRIAPSIVYLLIFLVLPVSLLFMLSFVDADGKLTFEHYVRLWNTPVYAQVLVATLKAATWTTVLCIVGGYPVAYLLSTVGTTARARLTILVLMPFWTSFLVRTFAWIVILGRKGPLNTLLMDIGLIERPLKMIFNFSGVMIGMTHALMPLAVLTMLSVMEGIDRNLSKAGGTLGARGSQTFWRVYFPLSFPGIAASSMLVLSPRWVFITPALLGGAGDTMIVQTIIFQVKDVLNWGFAGAIGVLLMIVVLIIFFVYDKLVGLTTLSGGEARKAATFRQNPIGYIGSLLGGWVIRAMATISGWFGMAWERVFPPKQGRQVGAGSRFGIWFVASLVLAFLALPALFVIPVSFTEAEFLSWPPQGFAQMVCVPP